MIYKHNKLLKSKGISIAVVLMVIAVLILITGAAVTLGIRNLRFVNRDKYSVKAFYAAEAGISKALSMLRADESWDGREPSGNPRPLTLQNIKLQNSDETYTVNVFNNFFGTTVIDAVSGVRVPVGNSYLFSEGSSAQNTRKEVGVMLKRQNPFGRYGVFGNSSVSIEGNVSITAYDSTTGLRVFGEADVGTNGNQEGAITVEGLENPKAGIDGSLYVGPGSTLGSGGSITITGEPNITGTQNVMPDRMPMPEVELPSMPSAAIPSLAGKTEMSLDPGYHYSGSLNIRNHQTVTLTGPGTYIFDKIDIAGQGNFIVDSTNGPVIIYMNGPINMTGGSNSGPIVNQNQNSSPVPGDLQIYATAACTNINLGGNAAAAMAVYAPNTDIAVFGTSNFYGALVGNTINIPGNPDYFYDVALQDRITPIMLISIESWQRY